ncbi:MAG TPA: class I SAM-dependent methyltransferase [Gaiellaceae bacterium]|jgi:ubiquinone/menaquinone biosynthesis C-methylase UbiE
MGFRSTMFAAVYDRMSRANEEAGVRALRQGLLAGATGRVLEIGSGTGANLGLYADGIEKLVMTEPEAAMLKRLQQKAREQAPDADVVQAPAEALPFEEGSFDTVVSTLVLCGVGDQSKALGEAHRVLRPGGQLLFLEHVLSNDPDLAKFQNRMNWLNRLVVQCDCNRNTLSAIGAAGFDVTQLEHSAMPKAPKFVRPLIVGAASA